MAVLYMSATSTTLSLAAWSSAATSVRHHHVPRPRHECRTRPHYRTLTVRSGHDSRTLGPSCPSPLLYKPRPLISDPCTPLHPPSHISILIRPTGRNGRSRDRSWSRQTVSGVVGRAVVSGLINTTDVTGTEGGEVGWRGRGREE